MKEQLQKINSHKATKKAKAILSWKIKILTVIVLPLVIVTFLTSRTSIIPGIRSYVVVSGSMQPTLPVGSVTYAQKQSSYKEGDIIAFTTKTGQTVTHRIVRVIKDKGGLAFQTKGDANNTADGELVSSDRVLGKVVIHLPYLGRVIQALRTPTGFVLFILTPALLFIFIELWNIKKEIERGVEQKMLRRMGVQKYEKIDLS